jgi:hypothetical protein
VSWLFTACLGPWAGWLAACNSLNTIKFEASPVMGVIHVKIPRSLT